MFKICRLIGILKKLIISPRLQLQRSEDLSEVHPPLSFSLLLSSASLRWLPLMAQNAAQFEPEQVFSQDKSPDTHCTLVLFTSCCFCCSHVKGHYCVKPPWVLLWMHPLRPLLEFCSFPLLTLQPWLLSLKQAQTLLHCICNRTVVLPKPICDLRLLNKELFFLYCC